MLPRRHLRHKDFENEEVRAELEKLALQIKEALLSETHDLRRRRSRNLAAHSEVEKVPISSSGVARVF